MKAHPHPEKRSAALEGSFMSAVPISLTDDMPPEIESPDFPQLLLKCIPNQDWTAVESCEKETELKLNMTRNAIMNRSLPSKEDREKLEEEEKKFRAFSCECLVKKMILADEMTGQLDMAGYEKYYETTSLSSEQKALAAADFISCMTANLIRPSLPIFVRWTESSNEVIGNLVTANHVIGCDMNSLIKNGCSDASVSTSTLTWIMQNLQTRIAKEILQ
ncbi:uncharacterized protein LOC124207858 isoform X2 [Daphnia pulex]|nr:uncharacterized protein LOC124207858 isoform X2 [Daphnia pulex]XP_046461452.1 uncharacterized protein LOC124207858 isoform X2 [Daphnia pulex]XP_046461453.1 uncharacterized protein LOC124207858 isoform X2 [Daphnia pulex]